MRVAALVFFGLVYLVTLVGVGLLMLTNYPPKDGSYAAFWSAAGPIFAAVTGLFTLVGSFTVVFVVESHKGAVTKQVEEFKLALAQQLEDQKGEIAKEVATHASHLNKEVEEFRQLIALQGAAKITLLQAATKAAFTAKRLEVGALDDAAIQSAEDSMTTAYHQIVFLPPSSQKLWKDIWQNLRYLSERAKAEAPDAASQVAMWRDYVRGQPRHIGQLLAEFEAEVTPKPK